MTELKEEMPLTLTGKETVEIVERLCSITGMTPACLVALMMRKYGKELELWIGYSDHLPTKQDHKMALPTDPGDNLKPIEL